MDDNPNKCLTFYANLIQRLGLTTFEGVASILNNYYYDVNPDMQRRIVYMSAKVKFMLERFKEVYPTPESCMKVDVTRAECERRLLREFYDLQTEYHILSTELDGIVPTVINRRNKDKAAELWRKRSTVSTEEVSAEKEILQSWVDDRVRVGRWDKNEVLDLGG